MFLSYCTFLVIFHLPGFAFVFYLECPAHPNVICLTAIKSLCFSSGVNYFQKPSLYLPISIIVISVMSTHYLFMCLFSLRLKNF